MPIIGWIACTIPLRMIMKSMTDSVIWSQLIKVSSPKNSGSTFYLLSPRPVITTALWIITVVIHAVNAHFGGKISAI